MADPVPTDTPTPAPAPERPPHFLLGPDRWSSFIGYALAAAVEIFALVEEMSGALGLSPRTKTILHMVAGSIAIIGRLLNVVPAKTIIALLVGGSLVAAAPVRADPLVHCFSGCGSQALKMKAAGPGDVSVSPTVWIGPGLGILPAVYNGATHAWSNPIQPVFSYGVWYAPIGWTHTKSLAGAAFSVSGDLAGTSHIDPLVTITLFDAFTIGGGVRVNFATSGQQAGVNALFAIGWQTSLGTP